MNFIMLVLMVALYSSSIAIMFFMRGQEAWGIGLFAGAMFVGAMELIDRMEKRSMNS